MWTWTCFNGLDLLDKTCSGSATKNEIISNKCALELPRVAKVSDRMLPLTEELHKSSIKKCEQRKVYSSFNGEFLGANLAGMQLISKYYKWFPILLCVSDFFSKYAWVVSLKENKGISVTKAFQSI